MDTTPLIAPLDPWEARWACYDEPTYHDTLNYVRPTDIVLDIGAGDLRLSRRIARIARYVFAIENQANLLDGQSPLPANLTPICGDARTISWPTNITLGVLLMRHCTHFSLYAARLQALGCTRLITNARWGMDVELVTLDVAVSWRNVNPGWYACRCGQVGFAPISPEKITRAHIEQTTEVSSCPACGVMAAKFAVTESLPTPTNKYAG